MTTTQTVSTTGSGLVFHNTYTANCSQQYINCIVAAERQFEGLWTNAVTINITFDEEARGTSATFLATNSWSSWVNVSYSQLRGALPANDQLPITDPTGGHTWSLPVAYARMLGLSNSAPATDDTVTLNSSFGWSFGQDVINTVEHEISEGAMGRVGGLGDQNSVWSTMDLFRFSSSGTRDVLDGRDGKTTYFSGDGSSLSSFSFNNEFNRNGTLNNQGDTADFTGVDVFGTGLPGETNTLSQTDIAVMTALGWTASTHTHVDPTISAQGFSVASNQAMSVAADLSISNPSGDSLTAYWIEDLGGGNGYITIGGVRESDGQWLQATGNWSNVQYVGGSSAGTDQLEVAVYDATIGSFIYSSQFGATTISHTSPTISAQGFSVASNQAASVAGDLSISNPSGDSLTAYWIEDLGGGNGYITIGGVREADGLWFQATGNWSNVQYVGGSSAGTDQLEVAAYDATIGSFVYSSQFGATTISHTTPTISAQGFSVASNQAVSVSSNLSISNPSGDSLTAYWIEDLGGGRGYLTVDGVREADGQWFQATGNWSNVQYVGGSSAGTDHLEVAAYDATIGSFVYSSQFNATTTISHTTPTISTQGFSVASNQAVSIAGDLNISNPSGDSLTAYWIEDLGGGNGYITIGGVREADGLWFQATGNWSNVQYVGGSSAGTDQLEVAAYDATIGSFVYSPQFNATTAVSHTSPTISAQGFSVASNQAVSVAGDLSISNSSGDSLTAYWIEDLGGGRGYLTVDGVREADGQWFQATGNWSNVQYVGGSSAGTDHLEVAVYDATTGSFVYSPQFNATTLRHINPTVTARSFSVSVNQTTSVAADLSISNPSGDSLTAYWIQDVGGSNGYITVDGVREVDGQWFQATGNWGNVQYVGGSLAGTDQLAVAAYDATTGSFVYSQLFNAATLRHSNPTVKAENFSVAANQAVSVAAGLRISNSSGDSLTAYWIQDLGGGNGYLSVGGVREADGQWFQATGNWSNVQYVGGSSPGTDQLEVAVYDAITSSFVYSSNFSAMTRTVPPIITSQNFSVSPNQTISVASNLSISNPGNDRLTAYWVENLGGGSGHIEVRGVMEPDAVWFQATKNWANVQYVGGSSAGTDQIEVAAYDATTHSYIFSSDFLATTLDQTSSALGLPGSESRGDTGSTTADSLVKSDKPAPPSANNGVETTASISAGGNTAADVDIFAAQVGDVTVDHPVVSGTLDANDHHLTINGVVTGGTATIEGTGVLEFGCASSANVTFAAGATGTLQLDTATNAAGKFTGTIAGFCHGDEITLRAINYTTGDAQIVGYHPNSSGGVLTLEDGHHSEKLSFIGTDFTHLSAANFHVASDTHGHVELLLA